MNVTHARMRSLGWAAVLALCVGLFVLLSLKVHAVKSEVLLAEREIIRLERATRRLETEFQARANQRQLAEWNRVEFGYEAPRADQYIEGERQLASLGQPRGPDAPAPIRVARADLPEASVPGGGGAPDENGRAMVSPVTGKPVTFASAGAAASEDAAARFADAFGDFLIDASPIRPARAQVQAAGEAQGAAR
ncbi:hypothetical protein [Erythrobacter sp.]|uniref:hypothetical protein n=1 Tax=Erythrobacter sp. TaxID=1042 RepID=UPI001425D69E|nr:hypothetical protein [Erythrobacter sp.]QIQ86822.1 MAG: hypothetical protein G9473_09100 [Erythrobacter sp.]